MAGSSDDELKTKCKLLESYCRTAPTLNDRGLGLAISKLNSLGNGSATMSEAHQAQTFGPRPSFRKTYQYRSKNFCLRTAGVMCYNKVGKQCRKLAADCQPAHWGLCKLTNQRFLAGPCPVIARSTWGGHVSSGKSTTSSSQDSQ